MMKNIIYAGILLFISNMVCAQKLEKVVGVNTKEPKETLDVNGTMRIDDIESSMKNTIPLGWIPKENENDEDYGQVVKRADSKHSPLYYLTYKINFNDSDKGSHKVAKANLKIDASKYIALLSQAYLVRKGFNFNNPSAYGSYIYTVAKQKNTDDGIRIVKTKDGKFVKEDGKSDLIDTKENLKYIMGSVQPDTDLFVENGYYFFKGDYKGSKPIEEFGPYSWVVNVIIIEKPKS